MRWSWEYNTEYRIKITSMDIIKLEKTTIIYILIYHSVFVCPSVLFMITVSTLIKSNHLTLTYEINNNLIVKFESASFLLKHIPKHFWLFFFRNFSTVELIKKSDSMRIILSRHLIFKLSVWITSTYTFFSCCNKKLFLYLYNIVQIQK